VDIATIAYGTNDWSGNNVLDNDENRYDTATVCGALRYSVEALLTAFPQLRIFVLLPTYRFWMDSAGAFTADSETATNQHGKTLVEYCQGIADVAAEYNLPIIDNYRQLGINKFNRALYFPATDGTHHNENGRKLLAANIVKNLW
jgi:lysophospholipase L1-like esterase